MKVLHDNYSSHKFPIKVIKTHAMWGKSELMAIYIYIYTHTIVYQAYSIKFGLK
jgi:hypothetical protein